MSSRVAGLVLSSLRELRSGPKYCHLPFYSTALELCLSEHPPLYETEQFVKEYRRFATDPSLFASLLVTDADLEGYSADQLWTYSPRIEDKQFSSGMQRHARDEARHSQMFGTLIFFLFPRLEGDSELKRKLSAMVPTLTTQPADHVPPPMSPFEEVLNTAILINLHEVKALRLEHMLRPVAQAYCSPTVARKVDALVNALARDEVHHIGYTAEFIERAAQMGFSDYIRDAMLEFQGMLNYSTFHELESTSAIVE